MAEENRSPHESMTLFMDKKKCYFQWDSTSLASYRVQLVTFEERKSICLLQPSGFFVEKYLLCSCQDDQNVFLTCLQVLHSLS